MTPTNQLRFVEREETFDGFSLDDQPAAVVARAMNRLKAALAEPVQEPVAWMYTGIKQDGTEHGPHLVWNPAYMDAMSASKGAKATPLYTAPPQRKPLSNEELDRLWREPMSADWEHREFARAVEAAHGIKEGT
jgi:hypothetical protein